MPGRRQFTSCTPCRHARLGCDAASKPGRECSNCIRRGRSCTVPWVDRGSGKRQEPQEASTTPSAEHFRSYPDTPSRLLGSVAHSSVSPDTSLELEQKLCRRQQGLMLHHILWDIFVAIWESRFSLWVESSCCPYINTSKVPASYILLRRPMNLKLTKFFNQSSKVLLSRLMLVLDNPRRTRYNSDQRSSIDEDNYFSGEIKIDSNEERLIDKALVSVVHAWSVRWLPLRNAFLLPEEDVNERAIQKDIQHQLWHRAHEAVYAIMSRPTYRSSFALQLFSSTPVPSTSMDQKVDKLCQEVAILHLIRLHTTAKSGARPFFISGLHPNESQMLEHEHMEDRAFWFGVIADTVRSLTQRQPLILLPGKSAESRVWSYVRARTEIFDKSFRPMHHSQHLMSAEMAAIILQHGSACKSLFWWTIARVHDALFHHIADETIEETIRKAVLEYDRFQDVFGPLLNACFRDFMALSQQNQVSYYLLVIHYNYGVLLLLPLLSSITPVVSSGNRLLEKTEMSRLASTRAIINVLSLVLQTDAHTQDNRRNHYNSLLLLDPTPEYMARILSCTADSLFMLHKSGDLFTKTIQTMFSVLASALAIIANVSESAAHTLKSLHTGLSKNGLVLIMAHGHRAAYAKFSEAGRIFPICDAESIQEAMKALGEQAQIEEDLVQNTIARYDGGNADKEAIDFDRSSSQHIG